MNEDKSHDTSNDFCAKDWTAVIQRDLRKIQGDYGEEEALLYLFEVLSKLYKWKRSIEALEPRSRKEQKKQRETWQWTTEMQIDLQNNVESRLQPWEVLISGLFMDLEPMKKAQKTLRKSDVNRGKRP